MPNKLNKISFSWMVFIAKLHMTWNQGYDFRMSNGTLSYRTVICFCLSISSNNSLGNLKEACPCERMVSSGSSFMYDLANLFFCGERKKTAEEERREERTADCCGMAAGEKTSTKCDCDVWK